jgi:hypothetical protein
MRLGKFLKTNGLDRSKACVQNPGMTKLACDSQIGDPSCLPFGRRNGLGLKNEGLREKL